MRFLGSIPRAALAFLMFIALAGFADDTPWQQSVEKWRQDYEAKLKSDSGWLTVAGLFWLHEGDNFFGSDPDNDIVLPYPSMPAHAGKFQFHQGATVAYITSDLPVTMKGKPVSVATLHPDSPDERLVTGDLLMYVHASGGRFAIRLKDKNSKLRREFHGTNWFPVSEAYRVTARFTRLPEVRPVEIETVLGDREKLQIAGYCTFKLNGEDVRLDAEQDETGALFIVFSRPDQCQRYLPGRALPRHPATQRRHGRTGFQQSLQPALRLQSLHDLPPARAGEPSAHGDSGGREALPLLAHPVET